MSKKLAKVLLICALVVILPLFVAGTVIAVYYSMNAVTTFEVYTNNSTVAAPAITSASATVEYDAEKGTYSVINGHSKNTSVEYTGEGFNLDYWFDGSREDYVKLIGDIAAATDEDKTALEASLDEKKISNSEILSFKTGDYENITAVFSIIEFKDVQYSIKTTPNGAEVTGTVDLVYGQSLAEALGYNIENTDTHDFLGYIINDDESKIYTNATFPEVEEGGNIIISTLWKETPKYQVRYMINGQPLKDGLGAEVLSDEFTRQNYGSITIINPMDYKTDGYTAALRYRGIDFTAVTLNMLANPDYDAAVNYIDVDFVETPINYNIQINTTESTATYNGATTFSVNAENYATFETVKDVNNWEFDQFTWEFSNFTYNTLSYTTSEDLIEAITTANPDSAPTTINVTVNFNKIATTYRFNLYDATAGKDLGAYVEITDDDGFIDVGSSSIKYNTSNPSEQEKIKEQIFKVGYELTNATIRNYSDGVGSVTSYGYRYTTELSPTNFTVFINSSIFEGDTTKTLELTYELISFDITISNASQSLGLQETISDVTYENYSTKLAPLFDENNWIKYSYVQRYDGVSVVGDTTATIYTDATTLFERNLLVNYNSINLDATDVSVTGSCTDLVESVILENGVTFNENVGYSPDTSTQTFKDYNASVFSSEGFLGMDLPANGEFINAGTTYKISAIKFTLENKERTFRITGFGDDYSIYNFLNTIIEEKYISAPSSPITMTLVNFTFLFAIQ